MKLRQARVCSHAASNSISPIQGEVMNFCNVAAFGADELLQLWQAHWRIESLFWLRNAVFPEDHWI